MANLVNHHDEELGEVKILNVHDIYEIIYEINRIFDISGFEAQLVGVWYWNREVTRSSPVEGFDFLRLLYAIAKIASQKFGKTFCLS